MQQLSKAKVLLGAIGGRAVRKGTLTVDPASLGAAARAGTTVALVGVRPGDIVYLEPPAALEAGLVLSGVVAGTDQITIYLTNYTAGAVDGASRSWSYVVIKTA